MPKLQDSPIQLWRRKERVILVLKCSKCGEEMEIGYVFMQSFGDGVFYWSKYAHTSPWRQPKTQMNAIEILNFGIHKRDKKYWLRRAYRCEICGLITFEEKYTLVKNEDKTT